MTEQKHQSVSSCEYDDNWIKETWGWDTPEEFVRTGGRNLRPRILYSLKLANLRPGMRILDIGCGRGEVILHCGRQGIYAVGADYSKEAVSLANKAKAVHTPDEQKYMRFICDDVKNIKDEEPFDRIFLLDLVEHLYDWELNQLFQVCKNLLKPDGAIIIHTLPNKWLYEITYRRLLRIFMPRLPENPRSKKEESIHINEMTIIHLHRLLKNNGFSSRIWLDDLITKQAKWVGEEDLIDRRKSLYKWMRNPFMGKFYHAMCLTPLRILIANDIFAVAVKQGEFFKSYRHIPQNRTESVIIWLAES